MENRRPRTWQVLLAFGIIYFVWGSTFLAIRVGVRDGVHPVEQSQFVLHAPVLPHKGFLWKKEVATVLPIMTGKVRHVFSSYPGGR
jgi:hypothetical protein